ncbi:hypothetical protein ACFWGI_06745 [Streptomyces niveus]|uniref:hypothetical protein n=1 Tax=Streptomyces niveus TaxID=193462 RepID=UPI003666B57E
MKITIEGADEEFAEKSAELTITTLNTDWTVERAERYLLSLNLTVRQFAAVVVGAAPARRPGPWQRRHRIRPRTPWSAEGRLSRGELSTTGQ